MINDPSVSLPDPDDRHVLAAAIFTGPDVIVTCILEDSLRTRLIDTKSKRSISTNSCVMSSIWPVLYHRISRLFTALALARGDGRYAKLMTSLARAKLLILDDWGPETLSAEQARDLMEIIEDRADAGSLIITSQIPVDRWHDMIGIPTLADAILDRLVHNAYRIELKGESLRKQRKPDLT